MGLWNDIKNTGKKAWNDTTAEANRPMGGFSGAPSFNDVGNLGATWLGGPVGAGFYKDIMGGPGAHSPLYGLNDEDSNILFKDNPGFKGQSWKEVLAGKNPINEQRERDREHRKGKREAVNQGLYAQLLAAGMGVRGGAQFGAGQGVTEDFLAQLRKAEDAARMANDVQAMQTLQMLFMMLGYI